MSSTLSNDTLISAFSFLKRRELTAIQLVCQRLHKVVQENVRVIHIIESLRYYDSDIPPKFDAMGIYPLFCQRLSGILMKIIRPNIDNPPEQTSLLSLPLLKECPKLKLMVFRSDKRDQGLLSLPEVVDWLHQYSCPPVHRSINIFATDRSAIALRNCTIMDVVEELKKMFESSTKRCNYHIAFEVLSGKLEKMMYEFSLTNATTQEQLALTKDYDKFELIRQTVV
uniref:F-box domain-containing protein n=1 Tax=Ditylenchus dipsaci TaxID=166011 RepID=A0A915D6X1_9BILA